MILSTLIYAAAVFFYALGCSYSFRYYKNLDGLMEATATRHLAAGSLMTAAWFVGRWSTQGYAPLVTINGVLAAMALALALALLLGRARTRVPVLTALFLPFIFVLSLMALLASVKPSPLMDSRLMTAGMASHIFLIFLGFAHFTLGFGVGVAFWIQEGQLKQHRLKSWSYGLPALEALDRLTVFYVGLGFLFWGAGLWLGAVQAFDVWNRLPLSDPKILGSFVVLLIYACFFALRWGLKMRGRKSMALVMAGYFLALFTFVGVRLFLSTQHAF